MAGRCSARSLPHCISFLSHSFISFQFSPNFSLVRDVGAFGAAGCSRITASQSMDRKAARIIPEGKATTATREAMLNLSRQHMQLQYSILQYSSNIQ